MYKASSKHVALASAGLFVALYSPSAQAQCVKEVETGDSVACFTLFAGQTIDTGSVCFEVIGDNLDVTYTTLGGWELEEAHLWVGAHIADMPQTRHGSPIPGHFPHVSGDITGATTLTFSIPLSDLPSICPDDGPEFDLLAAAHAALRRDDGEGGYQSETGWSDGSPITSRGGWATLSTVTVSCECGGDNGGGSGGNCETAFSLHPGNSVCFLDIDEDHDGTNDFNRWGWTNGPYVEGVYTLPIYAGAGQCDTSKGTYVGVLTVTYSADGTATAEFTLNAPYTMDEAHFYAGAEILARDNNGDFTVAPGQYPVVEEDLGHVSTHSTSIERLSGDIHIVAHAVVCGPAE